jgi:hypothetical protein
MGRSPNGRTGVWGHLGAKVQVLRIGPAEFRFADAALEPAKAQEIRQGRVLSRLQRML